MLEIIPFIGRRYNPRLIENLADVLAPPYDVISPEEQQALHDRHECNVIRLILGQEQPADDDYNNKYSRAASHFANWKANNTLIDDEKAGYYVYEQEFCPPGQKRRLKRRGFTGLLRLEPLQKKGRVLAHERTFSGPRADRLKLIRACQANFSSIFMVYRDPEKASDRLLAEVAAGPPEAEFTTDDGLTHRLWLMTDAARTQEMRAIMKTKTMLIADGHHRYETAIQYSLEMQRALPQSRGPHAFNYMMVYCNNSEDEGLEILPNHRVLDKDLGVGVEHDEVVEDLARYFDLKSIQAPMDDPDQAEALLQGELDRCTAKQPGLLVLFPDGRAHALSLKSDADIDEMIEGEQPAMMKRMPVNLVQQHIIPQAWIGNPEIELEHGDITYPHDIKQVLRQLNSRKGCVAFILQPVKMDEVFESAGLGHRMPQKSTFFFPKLISGLVMRDMRLRL